MPEIDLTTLYSGMQKEMLQKLSTGANAVVHSGTKGDNTESNWINWFQEYLPKRYKVDKGIVIDSTGKQSEQIDLIIYDAQYSYLVFRQNDTLLIPAESVYAVFEVKQNLNKGHKEWSTAINKENNNEYKPLVKIFKWWRRCNCPEDKKYPKGITLEKIVADNLGDSSLSTEDFLIATMQNIVSNYKESYVNENANPIVDDPSEKIDENDLLEGYFVDDFADFVNKIEEHVNLLNTEGTTNASWRKVLGTEFPNSSAEANNLALSNLKKCIGALHRQRPIWPIQRGGAAFIAVRVTTAAGEKIEYSNNGVPLDKGCSLHFRVLTGVKQPFKVMWQITNTGVEAQAAECLRGDFEESDYGLCDKYESTSYSGSHSVQCFIIKKGICVAKSEEFIVNVR